MGTGDRAENQAENVGGKIKESVGEATDNRSLEREGQADQASAKTKQAGEDIKDALRGAANAVKGDEKG